MGFVKWYLFLLAVQNLWSSNREDTGQSPAPVGILILEMQRVEKLMLLKTTTPLGEWLCSFRLNLCYKQKYLH